MMLISLPIQHSPEPVSDDAGILALCRPVPLSFVRYCGRCGAVMTACGCDAPVPPKRAFVAYVHYAAPMRGVPLAYPQEAAPAGRRRERPGLL